MTSRTPDARAKTVLESVDPTINDDETKANDVGTRWINEAAGSVWFCVDSSVGAAVWIKTSPTRSPCATRDIDSPLAIQTRTTCFFDQPVVSTTITIQGDGRMLVH